MINFKILDYRLREFSKRIGLEDGYSYSRINGMIFSYYIIAIKKLFLEETKYKYKYKQLKDYIFDKDLNQAAIDSKPNNCMLKIIRFSIKIKM